MKFELFQALAASATSLFVLASATPFRLAGSTTANNVAERNLIKRDDFQTTVNKATAAFGGQGLNVGSSVRYFANIGFEISVCIAERFYRKPCVYAPHVLLLDEQCPRLRFKYYSNASGS